MVKTENINIAETDKAETDKAETDKNQKSKLAVILFTRVPIPGQTKTRLSPMLSEDCIARLHAAFIKDIAEEILTHSWAEGSPDLFIAAHPFDQVEMLQDLLKEALPNNGPAIQYIPQVGADIGEKMKNAMAQVLELGYDYASLIGSDIPRLKAQHLEESFASRDAFDVSIGPSLDGGYFLVGMKALVPQFFENNSYSTQSALQEAQANLDKTGKSHTLISRCPDMDSPEDLIRLYSEIRNEAQAEALIPILTESTTLAKMPNTRSFLATDKEFLAKIYLWQSPLYMALGLTQKEMRGAEIGFLAQGEYHLNYSFVHPKKGKKLVLRINTGSQLHLKNQIVYEYTALKALESSGRTPKPIYVDDTKSLIPHGVLVMDFLEGRMLDYQKDLSLAAACLAEIHKTKVDSALFIAPQNVAETVLKECEQMIQTFEQAEFAPQSGKNKIRALLQKGWALPRLDSPYNCCINTELNNTNFIVDGDFCSLVDWEKPLFGDPAQDLAHFLAPTTTLWRTEVLLSKKEMRDFVSGYIDHVQGAFSTQNLMERVDQYIRIQCLRGICWCAMAWVLYQEEGKMLLNESTRKKLEMYISDEFLDKINGLF